MRGKVIIIAEAGVNHNGDLAIARKLIEEAKRCGADYVKFQTYITENLVSVTAEKANYQIENTGNNESQYQMLKQLELSPSAHFELKNHCQKCGIKFLSSAFDLESIDFLHQLNVEMWKIPSGEITNKPYLEKIGGFNQPTILSTGMSNLQEIAMAIDVLYLAGLEKENLTLLHCTSDYPTPLRDVNLKAMQTIASEFGVKVGYSDHTQGSEVAIAAVALGAIMLEKHFTLDKNMFGPDHKASLDTDELKTYIDNIRNTEIILGDGIKRPTERELETLKVARKSIHAKHDLSQGHVLQLEDIEIKRPGGGISPMEIEEILGKKIKKTMLKNQIVHKVDLE